MRQGRRRRQGRQAHKGLLSGALDVAETVSGLLPGAIRGVRGLFNMREASYATPASFACVQNNITQMKSEQPVNHPKLGIAGMRVSGSQPFGVILLSTDVGPPVSNTFWTNESAGASQLDPHTIPLNPVALGGPLSVYGKLYDRFVIRSLRLKYTSYQTTNVVGILGFCIEKDIANLVANSFDTLRQVCPNVTFPIRIPKAELDYVYDGPELYYCTGQETSSAEMRQIDQGAVIGFTAVPDVPGSPSLIAGFVDVEYVVDFFDPVPPVSILGRSVEERHALEMVRRAYNPVPTGRRIPWCPTTAQVARVRDVLHEEISAAAASCSSSGLTSDFTHI